MSELETLLAVERAEGARRLREMDGLMRQTRSALHELQGEFRRAISERDDLLEQVEERDLRIRELEQRVETLLVRAETATSAREGATAEVVSAAISRAQSAEVALGETRRRLEALQQRVRELEHGAGGESGPAADRMARLERDIAIRTQELVRAAETIGQLEDRLEAAGRAPAALPAPPPGSGTETDASPDLVASATSSGSSTYFPVDAEIPPSAPSTETDESATYLPVGPPKGTGTESVPASPPPDAALVPRVQISAARSPRKRPPAALPVLEGLSVEREVARDAHGLLLHARDVSTGHGVAVLVLPRGTVRPSPASVARLTAVQHHNVARALRCDLGPDGPYVVSERPTGERVDAWVRRVGGVSERIALAVAVQVARGLREAAGHGVHHGDLGPEALWMDGSGVVRISGLGLCELVPHRELRAAPGFVAPERRRGEGADARSDMHALGVCLRFLVGGAAVIDRDAGVGPPASPRFRELCATLAASDRDGRPASWDAAVELLEAALRTSDDADRTGRESAGLVSTLSQRPHLAVGALAIVALVVAAWLHFQPAEETAVRKAFNDAVVRAAELEAQGNVEGARRIYLEFVEGTGDPDIELDAARRLDLLRR